MPSTTNPTGTVVPVTASAGEDDVVVDALPPPVDDGDPTTIGAWATRPLLSPIPNTAWSPGTAFSGTVVGNRNFPSASATAVPS